MFSTITSPRTTANSSTNNRKKRKANSDDDGDDGGSIQVGQAAATAAEAEAVGPNDTATTTAEAATDTDTNTDTNNPSSQLSSLESKMNEFINTMKDYTQNAALREEKSEKRAIVANTRSERLEILLKKAVQTTDRFLKDHQQQVVVVVVVKATGAASVSSSSDEEGQQQQLPLNVDVDAEIETTTGSTIATTTTTTAEKEAQATALALALSSNPVEKNPENIVLNSETWSTMLKQLQEDGYDILPVSNDEDNDDDNDDDDDEDNNTSTNNNSANSKYVDFENANDANHENKESLASQGRKRNKYYKWEHNYQNLRYYRIKYGHCNVPQRSSDQKYQRLGKWVSNMRSAYTAQKLTGKNITTKISKNQIDKLNSIGFHWSIKNYSEETINESWYSMYEQLEQYKRLTGNTNVVLDPSNNNPSQLAKWCLYQKNELLRLKQYKDTILTIDQIKLLYTIGMV